MSANTIGAPLDAGATLDRADGKGGFWRAVCRLASAFENAVAARHVYEGLVANHVARDKAAAMTRDMLFREKPC